MRTGARKVIPRLLWIVLVALLAGTFVDFYYEWPVTSPKGGYDYRLRVGVSDGYCGCSEEEAGKQGHAEGRFGLGIHAPAFGPPVDLGDMFGLSAFRVSTWLIAVSAVAFWWGRSNRKGKGPVNAEQPIVGRP